MVKLISFLLLVAVAVNAAPNRRTDVNDILSDRIEKMRMSYTEWKESPLLKPWSNEPSLFLSEPDNEITNITITGLEGFVINVLDLNLSRKHLEYSVTFPQLNASGAYTLNHTKYDGSGGPFSVSLSNVNLTGFIDFDIDEEEFVNILELNMIVTLERWESNIEGIFLDTDSNNAQNVYLQECPLWLKQDQLHITKDINTDLTPFLNAGVNQLTLKDLIGRQVTLDA